MAVCTTFGPSKKVEGRLFGPIEELVGKNDIAHLVIRSEPTHGGEGEDSGDSKGVKGPNVGPIRDPVWWDLVEQTVAGEKGNFYALHLSHHETW
jgi:hypothetical protein